jgi:CubicO group peptidase (beta-lactamase class C family)
MAVNLEVIKPKSAGFSAKRLDRIGKLMQDYVDRKELAGMIATVARCGKTVYLEKFGFMDIETQKPMQSDTIFRIASMTKPITSVAAMMLYEEGYFHLNTPISRFLPAFKDTKVLVSQSESGEKLVVLERPITFRHLFTHTSGLSYGFNPDDPIDKLYIEGGKKMEEEGVPPTMKNVIDRLAKLPLAFQPGTHWRYGFNIDVIGHIVEVISGQPLDDFLRQRIFEPLGMRDTDFYVPPKKAHRLATVYGHNEKAEGLQRMEIDFPSETPVHLSGGGGLASTLEDYARFAQMLVNKGELEGVRLLSPSTVELFSLNNAPAQALPYGFTENDLYHAGYGYGLGMRVLMDVSQSGIAGSVGEFGWDGAYSTYFWIDPKQALYGLLMLQHYPNAYYPIAQQFKALTYQALLE